MRKAALYARVSSDIQKKEGTIQSQIAELKRQIRANGDKLVKEYIDDGYTGAILARPAMDQLRKDLKTDLFEVIYILNTDRIARSVAYQTIIITEFLQYQKQFIINGQDYVNNPENHFSLTVLGAVSEFERAKIMERNRRGRQHRLSQGRLMSNGNHIFGYRYEQRTHTSYPAYVINEEEARIVKYIYETYAKGEIGIRTLARHLQEKGIKARNRLKQTQLQYILQNETYTGTKYFNTMTDTHTLGVETATKRGKKIMRERSEWVGVKIPAIISKQLFDKVQDRLNYNRTCYRNALRTQLLSNLVWCGVCDSRCFAYRRYYKVERKDGTKLYQKAVYRCRVRGSGHNPEIDTRILESCVIDMIKETILNPERLAQQLDISKRDNETEQQEKELQAFNEKITNTQKQKERILDLYASGSLDREEYIKRIRNYDNDLEGLNKDRDKFLKTMPVVQKPEVILASVTKYCANAKLHFSKCKDFNAKRKFILEHIIKASYYRSGKDAELIKLNGFVPIANTDGVKAKFEIEQTVSRSGLLQKVRDRDMRNGTWDGMPITSMDYGKLVMANTPEITSE